MPSRSYVTFWERGGQPTSGRTRGQNRAREARYRRYEKYRGRTPARCALTYHVPMRCLLDGWIRRGQPILYLPRGMMLFGDGGPAPYGWVHAQCADCIHRGGQHLQALLRPSVQRLAAAAGELRRGLEPIADAVTRMYEHLQLRPAVFDRVREAHEAGWTFEADDSFDFDGAWQMIGSVQEVPGAVIELPTTPQYTPHLTEPERRRLHQGEWNPELARCTVESCRNASVRGFTVCREHGGFTRVPTPHDDHQWLTVRWGRHEHELFRLDEAPITTTYNPWADWGAITQPPGPEPGPDVHPVVAWDPNRCWKCDREPGLDALDGMCDRCYPALTGKAAPSGKATEAPDDSRSAEMPEHITVPSSPVGYLPDYRPGDAVTIHASTLAELPSGEYVVSEVGANGITLTPTEATE